MENYSSNPNVIPCQIALHPTDKKRTIYRLKSDHPFNKDLNGIASFNREHLLKFQDPKKTPKEWFAPDIDKFIIEEEVRCSSFDKLVFEYKISKIDLLQIDTEGFDYEILKMIDFNKMKPAMLIYEVLHLNKTDFCSSVEMLLKHNYRIIDNSCDLIAVSMDVLDALSARSGSIRPIKS